MATFYYPPVILGAGIAGLTTALALKQKGIDFLIVEAVPEIKAVGAGITLAGNAMRALHRIGVGEEIKRRGFPLSILTIADDRGKYISRLDASAFNKKYNVESVAIHRAELHNALLQTIPASKIITGKKAVSVLQDAEKVITRFEDGSEISSGTLIAADGIHSVVRQSFLPASTARYSGYTCWRGISRNKLKSVIEAVEIWGPAGRFGYVPVGANSVYWFATRNAPKDDARMKAFTIDDIARNYESYCDPVEAIIKNTAAEELLWNDIVDLKPISQYAFGRVVLIGDAAHATTPNMGQGAGLGIEDAAKLAELISQQPGNLPAAFQEFEKVRIPRAKFIVDTSYRLGSIAQVENYLGRKLRDMFLRMMPDSVNERQMKKVLDVN